MINRFRATLFLWLALGLSSWGQTIPPAQTYVSAWHEAGLTLPEVPNPRLIVNVRDFGAVGDGVANDYAAFNAAVTSLNFQAGVVFVPAGNYYLRSSLNLRSGVILRGESPTNTTITFSSNFVSQCINIGGAVYGSFQPIQSGATRLSSQITVTNPGVFSTGRYVYVRMYKPGSWGLSTWGTNTIAQFSRVTGITGNVVTLNQPLRLDYSPYEPQVAPFNAPMTNCGVENLRITREFNATTSTETTRNNVFTIRIAYAADNWVRGCDLYKCFGGHIGLEYSTHNEFRGNYFQEAHEYDGGGSGYGVRLEMSSCENLAENNVFRKMRHSMLNQIGANANVWGYNYSRDGQDEYGSLTSDITTHGNYPFANLAEGNICEFVSLDNSHGWNGPYNAFFRNKVTDNGFLSGSISDESTCRNEAYVGNEVKADPDAPTSRGFLYGNTKSTAFCSTTSQTRSNLFDFSYYLTTNPMVAPVKPPWWTIPQSHMWPIGMTNNVNNFGTTKYIPAKSRYDAGGLKTYAPPSIQKMPPESVLAPAGSTVLLSSKAYGEPSVTYAWFKDGILIGGATDSNLTLGALSAGDAGVYTVSFTDDGGSITSPPCTVFLFDGTLDFTNHLGYLDVPGNWDPPVGPPDSLETGVIASAGAPMEAVFRTNLPVAPAELIVRTGGVLRAAASLTTEHRLTLDGGELRGSGTVSVGKSAALRTDTRVGSDSGILSLRWKLSDHPGGAGRLIVSNAPGASTAFYGITSPYTGGTELQAGDMLLYSNQATGSGPVDLLTNANLQIMATTLIQTNPVVLRGGRVTSSLAAAFKAPVQVRADSRVGATTNLIFSLYGPIADHPEGAGKLIVSNATDGATAFYSINSTYSGGTELRAGEMLLYSNSATGSGPVEVLPGTVIKPAATVIQSNPVVLSGGRMIPHVTTSVLKAPLQVRVDSVLGSTNAHALSLYGPIQDYGEESGRLIVSNTGSGDVKLYSINSTYSGGTEVRLGNLLVYSNSAFGSGPVDVMPDGTLQASVASVQTAPVVMKGGRFYLGANANFTAPFQIWSESVFDATGSTSAALAGPIADYDATHTGKIIKKGTGYMALAGGTNLFSGGFDVREGTLAVTVNGSLGSGPVAVKEGAVLYLSCSNGCVGGSITVASNAIFQPNSSYSTNATIRPGGILRALAAGNRATYDRIRLEGDVSVQRQTGSGYLQFRGPLVDGDSPGRFVLTTTNPFPVTLYATNTYSGGTWLTDGGTNKVAELILAAGGSLPDTGTVRVDSNAVLNLNAVSDTIGSLEGYGEVKFGPTAATRLTVADDRETVFYGTISGTGGLVRAGTGALTLAGSNGWAGVTGVTGGFLRVDAPLTNGGPVTVYSNGFIGGGGTIGRALEIRAGGGFDWRAAPAALTVVTNGAFLFGTNGVFRYRFTAVTGSCLVVQGTLQLPAAAVVEPLSLAPGWPKPFEAVIMRADALSGAASLNGWTVKGRGYSVRRTATDVLLRYKPAGSLMLVR